MNPNLGKFIHQYYYVQSVQVAVWSNLEGRFLDKKVEDLYKIWKANFRDAYYRAN